MNYLDQPLYHDLKRALSASKTAVGTFSENSVRRTLTEMRNCKTEWSGEDELELRSVIDAHLKGE